MVLPECAGALLGCGQAVVPCLLSSTPKLRSDGRVSTPASVCCPEGLVKACGVSWCANELGAYG